LEYIFVDDCSPDKSIQVLEDVLAKYPKRINQVNIIHHSHNRGISAVRNSLVEHASGDFVFFVDSDDWVEFNSVELLVKRQQETNADIVTGRAYDHHNNIVEEYVDGGWRLYKDEALSRLLSCSISHSVWRRLIRISLFSDHNIRCIKDLNMDEDFLLAASLFYYAKVVVGIDSFIYHYMRGEGSSYIVKYHNDYNLQDQMLGSRWAVACFFKDKEPSLFKIALQTYMKRIRTTLQWAGLNHDRQRFYNLVSQIKEQKEFWRLIRWNNIVVRTIESNYTMFRCIEEPIIGLKKMLS
jgi:glycosyltransferase involved in cell wall biosynthesis